MNPLQLIAASLAIGLAGIGAGIAMLVRMESTCEVRVA